MVCHLVNDGVFFCCNFVLDLQCVLAFFQHDHILAYFTQYTCIYIYIGINEIHQDYGKGVHYKRYWSNWCVREGDEQPDSLLILAEEELVAVDLVTPGWPVYRLPYVNSIHASSIISASHVNNVPRSLWERIKTAGSFQLTNFSPRVCFDRCFHTVIIGMLLIVSWECWKLWKGLLSPYACSCSSDKQPLLSGYSSLMWSAFIPTELLSEGHTVNMLL